MFSHQTSLSPFKNQSPPTQGLVVQADTINYGIKISSQLTKEKEIVKKKSELTKAKFIFSASFSFFQLSDSDPDLSVSFYSQLFPAPWLVRRVQQDFGLHDNKLQIQLFRWNVGIEALVNMLRGRVEVEN